MQLFSITALKTRILYKILRLKPAKTSVMSLHKRTFCDIFQANKRTDLWRSYHRSAFLIVKFRIMQVYFIDVTVLLRFILKFSQLLTKLLNLKLLVSESSIFISESGILISNNTFPAFAFCFLDAFFYILYN